MMEIKQPDYEVFVDESFYRFFNLPDHNGNFAYLSLMLPTKAHNDLSWFCASFENRVRKRYERATGLAAPKEFKSTTFLKIPRDERASDLMRVSNFLRKHEGYVSGMYTSVLGLLANDLRTQLGLSERSDCLPENWVAECEQIKKNFLSEKLTHPGESALLFSLFHLGVGIPHQWLGNKKKTFVINYDPRNKEEDQSLVRHVDFIFGRQAHVDPIFKFGPYQGCSTAFTDQNATGLWLTDIILGEMRLFFRELSLLTEESSSVKLHTLESIEENAIFMNVLGKIMPWGVAIPFSPNLMASTNDSLRYPFTVLFPVLADGKLSCYSHHGAERIIDFRGHRFLEMID